MNIVLINSNWNRFCGRSTGYEAYRNSVNENIGNTYITYSLLKQIRSGGQKIRIGVNNLWEDSVPSRKFESINRRFDLAILVLQDQLRSDFSDLPFKKAYETLQHLRIPLLVVSLGVNTVTDQPVGEIIANLGLWQRKFYTWIGSNATSIGIRGEATREALGALGITRNVSVVGCPAFYEGGEQHRLVPRPWDLAKEIIATGLHSSESPLTFILQDEHDELKAIFNNRSLERIRPTSYPGFSQSFQKSLEAGRVNFFTRIDSWKQYIAHRGNIVVGSRVHGGVIAVNSGVPAVVTAGDLRSQEMCAHLEIPYRKGRCGLDMDLRQEWADYPFEKMNDIYQDRYRAYVRFLGQFGLQVGPKGKPFRQYGEGSFTVRWVATPVGHLEEMPVLAGPAIPAK